MRSRHAGSTTIFVTESAGENVAVNGIQSFSLLIPSKHKRIHPALCACTDGFLFTIHPRKTHDGNFGH